MVIFLSESAKIEMVIRAKSLIKRFFFQQLLDVAGLSDDLTQKAQLLLTTYRHNSCASMVWFLHNILRSSDAITSDSGLKDMWGV